MATPDPLDLPSGGHVTFRDSATHFKRSHYRRLAATVEALEDGTMQLTARSESTWQQVDILAEALVESWYGGGSWYLNGRPIPGDDPSVLEDLSNADTVALVRHLMPIVLDVLGYVRDGDEGKAEPPSAASNGSTPTSGSEASTPRATPAVVPVDLVTTLNADSQIL